MVANIFAVVTDKSRFWCLIWGIGLISPHRYCCWFIYEVEICKYKLHHHAYQLQRGMVFWHIMICKLQLRNQLNWSRWRRALGTCSDGNLYCKYFTVYIMGTMRDCDQIRHFLCSGQQILVQKLPKFGLLFTNVWPPWLSSFTF